MSEENETIKRPIKAQYKPPLLKQYKLYFLEGANLNEIYRQVEARSLSIATAHAKSLAQANGWRFMEAWCLDREEI